MRRASQKQQNATQDEAPLDGIPDQIYDTLVEAILDRALDPGTKLPEEVFCTHYGVSRTIVRVAIHRLQYDRLVDIQRNRGCFVVVPSYEEAVDVIGARKAIEPAVIRRVSELGTDADLARLRAHVDQEDEAYRDNDHRAALRLSGQFHLLLSGIANNRCVDTFLHNLICRSALIIATYSDVTGCCKVNDHRRLVDLLEARDADQAAQLMTTHLDHIERDILHVKDGKDKPSLESVLVRYAKGGRHATKAGQLRLVSTHHRLDRPMRRVLENKNALVIGGAVGIGRAVCQGFAASGANVVVADKGWPDEKTTLLADLRTHGVHASCCDVDVTDETSVVRTVASAVRALGHVDILVNNAGVTSAGAPIQSQDWEVWDRIVAINLKGSHSE